MLLGETEKGNLERGFWGPRKDFPDKMTLKRKLKSTIKIVQAKEKQVMTKENSIKRIISIKTVLGSNYWESVVRNAMEEGDKEPTR